MSLNYSIKVGCYGILPFSSVDGGEPMQKKYVVRLSQEERVELTRMTKSDRVRAFRRTHAQVLLLADESEAGPLLA